MAEFISEAKLQAELFKYYWNNYPQTRRRIFHCPNGGSRNKVEALQLKAQGVVKGIPDLLILGNKGFSAIELKIDKGKVLPEQAKVHELWRSLGYKVKVCWSYQEAKEFIDHEFDLISA